MLCIYVPMWFLIQLNIAVFVYDIESRSIIIYFHQVATNYLPIPIQLYSKLNLLIVFNFSFLLACDCGYESNSTYTQSKIKCLLP